MTQDLRGALHVSANPKLVGENVSGSSGQNAEGNIGIGHPVDGFIDGPVAAGHQDQVGAAIDGLARNLTSVPRSGGRDGVYRYAARIEQRNGTPKRVASPPEAASV